MNKILSFSIYMFVFLLSLVCFKSGEGTYYSNFRGRLYRRICFTIGILMPCILAGLRSDNVGVDTLATVENFSRIASVNSFSQIYIGADFGGNELLYAVIAYIVSRISNSAELFLFILQLLTIIPVLLASIKLKERVSITVSMAVYLFCFFNNSLNLMRQSVACSFILLGVAYLCTASEENRKTKKDVIKVLLCFLFAVLFHKSSYLGVALVFVLYLVSRLQIRRFLQLIIYAVVVTLPLLMSQISQLMTRFGLMNQSFAYYFDIFVNKKIDIGYFSNPFTIYSIVNVLMRIMLVIVPAYLMRNRNRDNNLIFLRQNTICGLLIFSVILYSMETSYGQRIAMFLDYFLILFIPYAICDDHYRRNKQIIYLIIFIYWIIWVMIFGWSGSELYDFRMW